MERSLRIKSFKNIGFNDNNEPSYEKIVLNHSLKLEELGDLVILLGLNNSGKSNVLSALDRFSTKSFQENDITDLFMNEECQNPLLTLQTVDGKDCFKYSISHDNKES